MTQAWIDGYTSGGTTFLLGSECSGNYVVSKLRHREYPVSNFVEGANGWACRIGICETDPQKILEEAVYAARQTHGVTEVESKLQTEELGQVELRVRAILHGLDLLSA